MKKFINRDNGLYPLISIAVLVLFIYLPACSQAVPQNTSIGYGPNPILPEPDQHLIPTVNPAKAVGWPKDSRPIAAPGFVVTSYADGFDHPRSVYVLPDGDILIAETNAPPKPQDKAGIKGFVKGLVMKKAGAVTESANRITLLRDSKGNGVIDTRTTFLTGLHSPFGMALIGHDFYVADTDALLRFPYHPGDTTIRATGVKVADLPAGPLNHHWTKDVVASQDGKTLYVSVGSNSNAGENGIEKEKNRASILRIDPTTGNTQLFASGLRNPVKMAWQPQTGALWVVVNERDELGDNLVPDYLTSVKENAFYGFPYSYWGQHPDPRVKPQRPDIVAKAVIPDYGLGNHNAPLGIAFYEGSQFPDRYKNGAFISFHGSWNKKVKTGYKVVFVPFDQGQPKGMPEDILTGFLNSDGDAQGRPVGVAVDKTGALLVVDDVGNTVWRVTKADK